MTCHQVWSNPKASQRVWALRAWEQLNSCRFGQLTLLLQHVVGQPQGGVDPPVDPWRAWILQQQGLILPQNTPRPLTSTLMFTQLVLCQPLTLLDLGGFKKLFPTSDPAGEESLSPSSAPDFFCSSQAKTNTNSRLLIHYSNSTIKHSPGSSD